MTKAFNRQIEHTTKNIYIYIRGLVKKFSCCLRNYCKIAGCLTSTLYMHIRASNSKVGMRVVGGISTSVCPV